MANPRIVLTGGSGYLGHHLRAALRTTGGEFRCLGRGRDADLHADLRDPDLELGELAEWGPELIIHAAAMSSMYACEQDPEAAMQVNARALGALRRACQARIVLVSTDLVFAGDAAPYDRAVAPRPLSAYGASKQLAEQQLGPGDLVLRLPLLFGASFDGRRGATDMLRRGLAQDEPPTLFENEYRTPLHVADAAAGVLDLALDRSRRGILHLSGGERLSRWELAQRFCALVGLEGGRLRRGRSEDPKRPKDVSLVADWTPERGLDAALAAS